MQTHLLSHPVPSTQSEDPVTTAITSWGARRASRMLGWAKTHHRSLDMLVPLLIAVLIVDFLTFSVSLGTNDDPGTYFAQAWAVVKTGQPAHYTYWYDHPWLGWFQLGGYAGLTNGFDRSDIFTGSKVGVLVAGEYMVILQLASCVLIFKLIRQLLPDRRWAAGLAVILFALSPLAINYQKMSFLDNITVPWMLAALVAVASKRRSLGGAFWAGVFMAVATLSKETAGIWLLVVGYLLWQNYGKGHRTWGLAVLVSVWFGVCFFTYGIYAIAKGELFPGPGHVSLIGSFLWQINREGAGSPIDGWLSLDYWLGYAAAAAAACVLLHMVWRLVRRVIPRNRGQVPTGVLYRMRPIMLGFVIMLVMIFRGGYVPAPLIIGVLPFAALLVAGVLGALWPGWGGLRLPKRAFALTVVRITAVFALLGGGAVIVAPDWAAEAQTATSTTELENYVEVLDWVKTNIPNKDAVIAVDDNMWTDLKEAGYTNVVWFYKLDLDPEVSNKYIPGGYKDIDYVVLRQLYYYIARDGAENSVIAQAEEDSELVAQIGDPGGYTPLELTGLYNIRKVNQTTEG